MVIPFRKNVFEFSNNVLGETRQKKLSQNNNIYKRYLFLKKIDLKDSSNKRYLEVIHKIFNDDKLFLSNYYKNNKIVVGKSHNKSETNLLQKNNLHKKYYFKKQPNKMKERTLSSATNITNGTTSLNLSPKNRKYYLKTKENFVTDEELKNIYQKWINKEKRNEQNMNKKHLKLNKINNFSFKEFEGILNLQNLILNKRKENNIKKNKIEQKLLRHTAKNRDKLLMNQINNFRIKREEMEELDNQNIESSINNKTTINNGKKKGNIYLKDLEVNLLWQTSLRDYQNNITINKKPNLNKKRCNSSNIMDIKNRYTSFHSFDKRDVIYNPNEKSNSIYAQITPSNNKDNEKIRDTLNECNICSKHFRRNKEKYKLENKIFYKTKIFDGLNIQGKKLINFEIELSKELEGKRKRLVKIPYSENEINSKIFAENNNINNKIDMPLTVKNTVKLHYN